MSQINAFRSLAATLLVSIAMVGQVSAQQSYGRTEFQASGSPKAHEVFLTGLLQLHNFEFDDARASFQEALSIDRNFTMAYWGESLSYEYSFWREYDTEASRAVLSRLGATPEERASKAQTAREKAYLHTVEILFGEGSQQEREVGYSAALRRLHEQYPEDLDAAAFYALSILVTTYDGRDAARYMRAAAITEEILDKNPVHPGALHYNIHSYDDPVHAPLGLRAAGNYVNVAPSAVHALHMGAHIYYALGMWEEGTDRNIRAFEEAVARQASPDDPYGGQAYHALTWLIYGLPQQGKREEARRRLALIEQQVERYGDDDPVHRQHYVATRASYIVDTQEWDSYYADVEIGHDGLRLDSIATDYYVQGLVALNRGDRSKARAALAAMGSEDSVMNPERSRPERSVMVPRLLRLALEGQIELVAGHTNKSLALIEQAVELEAGLPFGNGPAVPVQPMAELLADTYLTLGDHRMAKKYYELSLQRSVGRERSRLGLGEATRQLQLTRLSNGADPLQGITTSR